MMIMPTCCTGSIRQVGGGGAGSAAMFTRVGRFAWGCGLSFAGRSNWRTRTAQERHANTPSRAKIGVQHGDNTGGT